MNNIYTRNLSCICLFVHTRHPLPLLPVTIPQSLLSYQAWYTKYPQTCHNTIISQWAIFHTCQTTTSGPAKSRSIHQSVTYLTILQFTEPANHEQIWRYLPKTPRPHHLPGHIALFHTRREPLNIHHLWNSHTHRTTFIRAIIHGVSTGHVITANLDSLGDSRNIHT